MPVIAMCTNRDCTKTFFKFPVSASCPACKSKVIQACENPRCNEPIEKMVTDLRQLPHHCPACGELLRFSPKGAN